MLTAAMTGFAAVELVPEPQTPPLLAAPAAAGELARDPGLGAAGGIDIAVAVDLPNGPERTKRPKIYSCATFTECAQQNRNLNNDLDLTGFRMLHLPVARTRPVGDTLDVDLTVCSN